MKKICVEKPIKSQLNTIENLHDKANSDFHFEKLTAAFLSQKIWPSDSIITISFVTNQQNKAQWTPIRELENIRPTPKLDSLEKQVRELSHIDAIKKVVDERIQPIVGITFQYVQTNGMVRIGFDSTTGSWSLVGTDCLESNEETTMNFGWLDVGTIIHEFGHMLGMIHEHQNPKNSDIQWDEDKVFRWARETQGWDDSTTLHNIIERYEIEQLNASDFDKDSIMLYFFPGSLTLNGVGTNANYILSKGDIEYLSEIYPGGEIPAKTFIKENITDNKKNTGMIIFISFVIIAFIVGAIYIIKDKNTIPKFVSI